MKGRECSGKQKILFAWAKDAPAKELPKGGLQTIYNASA